MTRHWFAVLGGWLIGAKQWQTQVLKKWPTPSPKSSSMQTALVVWICTWPMEEPTLDFGQVHSPEVFLENHDIARCLNDYNMKFGDLDLGLSDAAPFCTGAGLNGDEFLPQITSYDYGAPLSEQGRRGQPGIGGPSKFDVIFILHSFTREQFLCKLGEKVLYFCHAWIFWWETSILDGKAHPMCL